MVTNFKTLLERIKESRCRLVYQFPTSDLIIVNLEGDVSHVEYAPELNKIMCSLNFVDIVNMSEFVGEL